MEHLSSGSDAGAIDSRGVPSADLQQILSQTAVEVWEALAGKRIFLTGGTGFVGCWLLESLIRANEALQLGLQVTVLSRNPRAFRRKAPHLANSAVVRLLEGNVRNLDTITDQFDVVVHAATEVVRTKGSAQEAFDEIADGTKQTLALAVRCRAQRYLLVSSGAVYGPQPADVAQLDEAYLGAPATMDVRSAYGQGKRISEWLVHCHQNEYGLHTSIARCFAFVGPFLPLDAHFAIGNFMRDALEGKTIRINSDGTSVRSYMYAADMAIWLLSILARGSSGRTYNVGSDIPVTIGEVAHCISQAVFNTSNVVMNAAPSQNNSRDRYVPDTRRAEAELGLVCTTDLQSAIQKTIAWARLQEP